MAHWTDWYCPGVWYLNKSSCLTTILDVLLVLLSSPTPHPPGLTLIRTLNHHMWEISLSLFVCFIQIQNAEDNESLQSLAAEEDVSLILYQAGFGNRTLTISNKGEAIQCILFHQVIKSRRDQIADLVHGLDTMSILELIRMNDACLSVVFPLTSEVAISESEFIGRLEYAQGLQANEKDVITWFEQYIKSLSVGRWGQKFWNTVFSHMNVALGPVSRKTR